jgi:hypothetical protein
MAAFDRWRAPCRARPPVGRQTERRSRTPAGGRPAGQGRMGSTSGHAYGHKDHRTSERGVDLIRGKAALTTVGFAGWAHHQTDRANGVSDLHALNASCPIIARWNSDLLSLSLSDIYVY